jgi:RimJ/RimL family protein N-acetyltransferase
MSFHALRTENFVIRSFEKKDLEVFAQYRSKEIVARYQSWTSFTYQDAVELFDSMDYSTFGTQGKWYQLAISTHETDEIVGDLAVHFIDQDQIEIGFTISPENQGKSVATEAVSSFLSYAFGELNKHRVVAITDAKNTAAQKLLVKLGFRHEGHFIQNTFFKGAWCDEYQYALLRSERKFS